MSTQENASRLRGSAVNACVAVAIVASLSALAIGVGTPAGAATCSVVSGIQPAESVALPAGCSHYFYVGSTSGGTPGTKSDAIKHADWHADLVVFGEWAGEKAISAGHATSDIGSFSSPVGNHAIAGAGVNGYTLSETFSSQDTELGPGCSGCGTQSEPGIGLDLSFTTAANDLVVILVGGQGTGSLSISGVSTTVLQNETYSEAGSAVYASAAVYSANLASGTYTAQFSSTSSGNNSGNSLGAVAYVLTPSAG